MLVLSLYILLATTLYYLGAGAMITEWLWSRYPPRVDYFMRCAACAGTWYGMVMTIIGHHVLDWRFLPDEPGWSFAITGLITMVTTPLIAARHDRALRYLAGQEGVDTP